MAAAQLPDVFTANDVQLLFSDQAEPPAASAAWQAGTLPFQEPLDNPATLYAWFRLALPAVPAELSSVYINNHMFGVRVWLNGQAVGGSAESELQTAMGWNLPLLVPLPAQAWQNTNNTLLIRLTLHQYTNVLATVLVGPQEVLLPLWQQRQLWQGKLSEISLWLCLLMSVFMLGLWWQRRQDQQYLWFGLSALCWTIPMWYMSVRIAPFSHTVFLLLTFIAIKAYAHCSLRFLQHLLSLPLQRLLQWHALAMVAVAVALPLSSATQVMWTALVGDALSVLALLLVLVLCWRQAIQQRDANARLVLVMVLIALVLFSRDIYEFVSATRSNTSFVSHTYMQLCFPLIMLVFFLVLIKRFVLALNESELLNKELEQRVAAINAQLEQSYAANRAWELKEATEQQKQKIYRDLHDDVGARLVSIMHAKESHTQSELAQSALASLRETVSSGNFQDEQLADLLTDAQHHMEARCHNSELSFISAELPALPPQLVSGNVGYHLKRMLQEVVSNIIKHAQASDVQWSVQLQAAALCLSVQDDGRGLAAGAIAGNGLTNIRYRAAQIGAVVDWQNTQPGCRWTLRIPLAALAAQPTK